VGMLVQQGAIDIERNEAHRHTLNYSVSRWGLALGATAGMA
jgi:hypothetical protein